MFTTSKYIFLYFCLSLFLLAQCQQIPSDVRDNFPCTLSDFDVSIKYGKPFVYFCDNKHNNTGSLVYALNSKSTYRVSLMTEEEAIKLYKDMDCVHRDKNTSYWCKCVNTPNCEIKKSDTSFYVNKNISYQRLYLFVHNYNSDTNVKAKVNINIVYR